MKKKISKKTTDRNILDRVYKILQDIPFCSCAMQNKQLYGAYCLRIIETLEMMEEENEK
jgi:hypothetical protein